MNGRAARLNLPAGKVGAVVGEDQFEIAHGIFRIAHGLTVIFIGFERHSFDNIVLDVVLNVVFDDVRFLTTSSAGITKYAAARQIYYCTYDPFFLMTQFTDDRSF